jgi:hypothetical protein
MSKASHYRRKAAEFSALARTEKNPARQIEHAKMAQAYIRLAEQADKNSETNIVYEPPPPTQSPPP